MRLSSTDAVVGGIWIDNTSASRVLSSPEAIFGELARRAGDHATTRGPRAAQPVCPVCLEPLDRVRTHGLEIDVCGEHGTWFDPYELTLLVEALRGEGRVSFALGEERTICCVACGLTLKATQANIGEEGLVCDNCWRQRQGELIESGDAQTQQRGLAVVGGTLLAVAAAMLTGRESRGRT